MGKQHVVVMFLQTELGVVWENLDDEAFSERLFQQFLCQGKEKQEAEWRNVFFEELCLLQDFLRVGSF